MLGMRQRWCKAISAVLFAGLLAAPGQVLLAFGPPVDADGDQPVAEVCTGEKLGTAIAWYDDSHLAARLAREQGKIRLAREYGMNRETLIRKSNSI